MCSVAARPPESSFVLNTLAERIIDAPLPDTLPVVGAGSLSFQNCLVEAKDQNEAYFIGISKLKIREGSICMNDYVIELNENITNFIFNLE